MERKIEKLTAGLIQLEEMIRLQMFVTTGFACDIQEKFPSSVCDACKKSSYCKRVYDFHQIMEDLNND